MLVERGNTFSKGVTSKTAQYATRQIGAGAEQKVYLHENGREVIKVNTGTYHGNWLEFFNRLLCHAILFPATKYSWLDLQRLIKLSL